MKLYTSVALCAEAEVTYRQVHYWTERGYLKTVAVKGHEEAGTGTRRIYDETEVKVAKALGRFASLDAVAVEIRRALTVGQGHVGGTGLMIVPNAGGTR